MILTQRWPALRIATLKGSSIEQNQVDTTKSAFWISGLTSSGTPGSVVEGAMYWLTVAPRARASPVTASTTRGSSSGSVSISTRSPDRIANTRQKLSTAWK